MSRPGGKLANRPLHFIFLADCSGSMSVDGKMQALNHAVREAIPHMRDVARANPHADVLVRALAFSDGARWVVPAPTPIEEFRWTDLTAGGLTDLGHALALVAEQLRVPPMSSRALPPVLALVSDGQPTDDFAQGLADLQGEVWGQKAVRIGIAIGADADLEVLQRFIGNPEIAPLTARNPEDLVRYIRWASTAVLQRASSPVAPSGPGGTSRGVPVPAPPPPSAAGVGGVTW